MSVYMQLESTRNVANCRYTMLLHVLNFCQVLNFCRGSNFYLRPCLEARHGFGANKLGAEVYEDYELLCRRFKVSP